MAKARKDLETAGDGPGALIASMELAKIRNAFGSSDGNNSSSEGNGGNVDDNLLDQTLINDTSFMDADAHLESTDKHTLSTAEKLGLPEGSPDLLSPHDTVAKRFYSLTHNRVRDLERKCTLLLSWFRRYPYFRTPCCGSEMCFKCKTSDWHEGVSCEHRMRQGLGAPRGGVQWCPRCGVPTVKSEGCNHIVCVCGASWEWTTSSVMYACLHGRQLFPR